MTRVMVVDPGGATGIAFWSDEMEEEYFKTYTLTGDHVEQADCIRTWIVTWMPHVIVCESFTITMQTLKKSRSGGNTTIELIGIVRWLAHANGVEFVLQSPSDKEWTTKHKIQQLGWKVKTNPDHEMSATKHLVRYLVPAGLIHPSRVA